MTMFSRFTGEEVNGFGHLVGSSAIFTIITSFSGGGGSDMIFRFRVALIVLHLQTG